MTCFRLGSRGERKAKGGSQAVAVYHSMHELIGNTPLVELTHLRVPADVHLYAKLELYNPGGSVKDRVGYAMIRDAEARGLLKPGGTIVEATAGNTGLGIAFAAMNRGYRVIFTVPLKFSEEKQIPASILFPCLLILTLS